MIRLLLLLLIRFYWLIPSRWRKQCIFKESCSKHVFRITRDTGYSNGIKAFLNRYKTCRPNYGAYNTDDGKQWIILSDDSVIEKRFTNI